MARGNFGERLNRERELREVTLGEITSATRIGPRFLEALENEDWEKLPGGVFNRGFVRSIARYLGLDEEAFLAEYDLAHGEQVTAVADRPENPIPPPPKWITAAVALGIVALLAGLFFAGRYAWRRYQARRAKASFSSNALVFRQPAPQTVSPAPASESISASPDVRNASTSPLMLTVYASALTHVTVKADGNLVFDTDVRAGDNRLFTAFQQFEVSASDSGAVLLDLNGQTVPPLGVPGSFGTIKLSARDLRQAESGDPKP
jgi:cytoskeleton protein RodZ